MNYDSELKREEVVVLSLNVLCWKFRNWETTKKKLVKIAGASSEIRTMYLIIQTITVQVLWNILKRRYVIKTELLTFLQTAIIEVSESRDRYLTDNLKLTQDTWKLIKLHYKANRSLPSHAQQSGARERQMTTRSSLFKLNIRKTPRTSDPEESWTLPTWRP
jgi:hypothetical protein